MTPEEFKDLCIRAGCVKIDPEKVRNVLGLVSRQAVYDKFRLGCNDHSHIQKLEALAREGKDANS